MSPHVPPIKSSFIKKYALEIPREPHESSWYWNIMEIHGISWKFLEDFGGILDFIEFHWS